MLPPAIHVKPRLCPPVLRLLRAAWRSWGWWPLSGPGVEAVPGVQGSAGTSPETTRRAAMAGSMTEIPVNGDVVPAYISLPPSDSGPGVVVIQEWWGLGPHIRNVTDRLAAQGFVAVAPDLYRGKET